MEKPHRNGREILRDGLNRVRHPPHSLPRTPLGDRFRGGVYFSRSKESAVPISVRWRCLRPSALLGSQTPTSITRFRVTIMGHGYKIFGKHLRLASHLLALPKLRVMSPGIWNLPSHPATVPPDHIYLAGARAVMAFASNTECT
jgi:hypothetical protein